MADLGASASLIDINNVLNDFLTQVSQLKMELRAHVGDVMGQINQLRIEFRGSIGDIMSQINQVRTEVRSCTGEVRTCTAEVASLKQENATSYMEMKGDEISIVEESQQQHKRMQNHVKSTQMHQKQVNIVEDPRMKPGAFAGSPMFMHHSPNMDDGHMAMNGFPHLDETRHNMMMMTSPPKNHQPNHMRPQQQQQPQQNNKPVKRKAPSTVTNANQQNKRASPAATAMPPKPSTPQQQIIQQQQQTFQHQQSEQEVYHQEIMVEPEIMTEYLTGDQYQPDDVVQIGPYVEIARSTYMSFASETRTNYLRQLLDVVFGKDILSTHTISGKQNDRPRLDENVVNDITRHAATKFGVEESCIKKYISDRCYNEFKKRAIEQIQQQA